MISLEDELRGHIHENLGVLINFFEDPAMTPVSDAEDIILSRDARKVLREIQIKFSDLLDAVDDEEMVLRIMPYGAPGKRHGEPAYDIDGMQMLVEVVDNFSENEFRNVCHRALSWNDDNPESSRANKKIRKLYKSVYKIKEGKAEKPVPVQ